MPTEIRSRSARLRELEADGLIKREVVSDRPIAVTYKITAFGMTTLAFLTQLKDWAEPHDI
jgi:DNA-binding HxlR family transcriptional regulator